MTHALGKLVLHSLNRDPTEPKYPLNKDYTLNYRGLNIKI